MNAALIETRNREALHATPIASVAVITYNHEPYIREALEGVLSQNCRFPVEVVVGDDCSTDSTRDILLRYQQRYPHVIRILTSRANFGLHTNFRRTVAACRGKYIALLEGDDYWHAPDKLTRQVDVLEREANVGMACSNYRMVDGVGQVVLPAALTTEAFEPGYDDIIQGKFLAQTSTTCYRADVLRDVLRKTTRYTSAVPYEDLQCWMELLQRARVRYIPEVLSTYRKALGSLSNPRTVKEMLSYFCRTTELKLEYLTEYSLRAGPGPTECFAELLHREAAVLNAVLGNGPAARRHIRYLQKASRLEARDLLILFASFSVVLSRGLVEMRNMLRGDPSFGVYAKNQQPTIGHWLRADHGA